MAEKMSSLDKEKSIYLMQIQYLEKLLKSQQLQCDELELQNPDLDSRFTALTTDRADISEYLKYEAMEADKKCEELVEQLEVQAQDDQRDREALKLQHSLQLKELQDRIEQQELENFRAPKFDMQLELEEQLMEQQSHMESKREELVRQKMEYEFAIATLKEESELKWTMLKEMLSKEAADMENKLPVLVQQERDQHAEVSEEIQAFVDQNQILWEQKGELQEKIERLPDLEHMRKKLVRLNLENASYKTELEDLTKTSLQLKAELKDCSSAQESLQEEEEDLRQLLSSATEDKHQKASEASELRAELQTERSSWRQLEANMQEASVVLRHILTDSEKTSKTRGMKLRLLEILQSIAPQEPGSTPEESSGGQRPQTIEPQTERTQTLNLATDLLYPMTCYRPGDLLLAQQETLQTEEIQH
ncbi:hypothetical protein VZT92_010147 [Zoarces viviparus]|uniref:Cilia- and flagella-associated protein 157 n=1 Tax=Zoarces viviparus TaxID=48416 RepID=A0AAW1FGP5_ZOAVI